MGCTPDSHMAGVNIFRVAAFQMLRPTAHPSATSPSTMKWATSSQQPWAAHTGCTGPSPSDWTQWGVFSCLLLH